MYSEISDSNMSVNSCIIRDSRNTLYLLVSVSTVAGAENLIKVYECVCASTDLKLG